MEEQELIQLYPRLWHMAHQGAWPAIRERGLMSSSALIDDYAGEAKQKNRLQKMRRPVSLPLANPDRSGSILRDITPMSDIACESCAADDLTRNDLSAIMTSRNYF